MDAKMGNTEDRECRLRLLALLDSLELLGGKWKLLLILYLGYRQEERTNFRRIQKELGGISSKVLASELRVLEENDIVRRTIQPTTVDYTLTDYGRKLMPIARELQQWGINHRERILGKTNEEG